MNHFHIEALNEYAVVVRWEAKLDPVIHRDVMKLCKMLEKQPFPGLVECVPAYASLTVYYDPGRCRSKKTQSAFQAVSNYIETLLKNGIQEHENKGETLRVPVCYEAPFAPDLAEVAKYSGLQMEEVIERHTSGIYQVYMLGFLPGFPYLGGMDQSLAVPRKQKPREKVAEGSVGIAGGQTGIYPVESPGGWQIIGRTPWKLFQPEEDPPVTIKAGDSITFYAIDAEQFEILRRKANESESN